MLRLGRIFSRQRPRAIIIAGWSTLAIGLLAVALALYQLREDALTQARRNISNLATLLAEQTAKSVQAIDIVLSDIQDDVQDQHLSNGRLASSSRNEALQTLLREKLTLIPQTELLGVIDEHGKLVGSSRGEKSIGLDLSDREYFQRMRDSGGSSYLSAPLQDRSSGHWTVVMARRLSSQDNKFAGLVVAGLRLGYFEEIYRSIDLPLRESFLLLRRDGAILVRHPDTVRRAGQVMPKDSPWYSLVANGGGFYKSPGYFDGITRMVAVRPLQSFPLVMNASISEDAVLALWRRQAIVGGFAALVIFGYAAYLMSLTQAQVSRLRASRMSIKVILNTMDQGLMMVDKQGVLLHCNGRARRLLNIPKALSRSNPPFIDVLKYQWETNQSGREEGTFEEFVRKRIDGSTASTTELKRPDGTVLEVRNAPMAGGGFVRTYTDITARKAAEDRASYLAHHDDLTDLTNRKAFRERLDNALRMARSSGRGAALLYLDLDHFKQINDTFGHQAGDILLAEVAKRMRACVRMVDTVARLGGDEFAIILPFLDNASTAAELAKRLIASVSRPYQLQQQLGTVGVSIGIAIYPDHASSAEDLIAKADEALYAVKRKGRNAFEIADHPVERPALRGKG